MGIYPLKSAAYNHEALQDSCKQIGIPNTIRSENSKSELGERWLKHCSDFCVQTEYTEPNHPHQNPVECQAEHLNRMVKVALKIDKWSNSKIWLVYKIGQTCAQLYFMKKSQLENPAWSFNRKNTRYFNVQLLLPGTNIALWSISP